MVSSFRNALEFFDKIGIYDVVLPFLLVFTIVFAILEKTKVFGSEEVDGKKLTKKNLNSMAAFVIALLVVASSKLVATITEISQNVILLLLLSVLFLLLIGSFYKEDQLPVFLEGKLKYLFITIMFVGLLGIFLHAIKAKNGDSWLSWIWDRVVNHWSSTAVASIILVIIIVAFMFYIVRGEGSSKKEEKK
jgi:hypothetical membrane protein